MDIRHRIVGTSILLGTYPDSMDTHRACATSCITCGILDILTCRLMVAVPLRMVARRLLHNPRTIRIVLHLFVESANEGRVAIGRNAIHRATTTTRYTDCRILRHRP